MSVREIDWEVMKEKMNRPIVIDGRNAFDPKEMQKHGILYGSFGREVKVRRLVQLCYYKYRLCKYKVKAVLTGEGAR